jgi:hypothetical protein
MSTPKKKAALDRAREKNKGKTPPRPPVKGKALPPSRNFPAAKKGKMPSELLERFKGKAAGSKGKAKPVSAGEVKKRNISKAELAKAKKGDFSSYDKRADGKAKDSKVGAAPKRKERQVKKADAKAKRVGERQVKRTDAKARRIEKRKATKIDKYTGKAKTKASFDV